MKLKDVVLLWMLYQALRSRLPRLPPEAPGSGSPDPDDERWLKPGVYWYCVSPSEAADVMQWFTDRVLMVQHVKLLGSNGIDCAITLFELTGVGYWHLAGDTVPKLAPRGLATTLDDLVPEPTLGDFFFKKAQQTIEAVRRMDQRIQQWLNETFGKLDTAAP